MTESTLFERSWRTLAKLKTVMTALVLACLVLPTSAQQGGGKNWTTGGHNAKNTRYSDAENKITPANAGTLAPMWTFESGSDISATPAVDGKGVYFPDWGGNFWKLDRKTGEVLWSRNVGDIIGQNFSWARVSPAVKQEYVIAGTQLGSIPNGAKVFALDKETGETKWVTQVDNHFASIITQSPQVVGNSVYVGVSSLEELFAADPNYPCCSFRGSLVKLDLETGAILWKTYTTPAGGGFSGNAVWGSTPSIDNSRNSVYIATGNNYTVPQEVLDCVENNSDPQDVIDCVLGVPGSSENWFDAVMSLDLTTGAVNWATPVLPFDAWTVACFFDPEGNCPDPAGPDYDFGQAPALYTKDGQDYVGVGQKSGIYWALDPDNGEVFWSTQVGPGGEAGGLQWGSATDGNRIYAAVSNSNYVPHILLSGATVYGGFWSALDAGTGQVLWETAGNNPPPFPPPPFFPFNEWPAGFLAQNQGAVSGANGVVFAGSTDYEGTMYAFDASTGSILWTFASGASINSGAAISNGEVFWGSGYTNFGIGTGSGGAGGGPVGGTSKMFAFGLNGSSASGDIVQEPLVYVDAPGYRLDQNAPNPFTGSTDLSFEVPEQMSVSLNVYNLLGQLQATLVDGEVGAGVHRLTWDAVDAAPGTYFLHLKAGSKSFTRIMLIAD